MTPKYLGASGHFVHDAAFCQLDESGNILYASLTERYTKTKHCRHSTAELWDLLYHPFKDLPDFQIVCNEDFDKKRIVQPGWMDRWRNFSDTNLPMQEQAPHVWAQYYAGHPMSHACAAFMTRPKSFAKEDCVTVTVDGTGENQAVVIFDSDMNVVYHQYQPKSVGYVYGAFTQYCGLGLQVIHDEYVVMGLSSYGEPTHWEFVYDAYHSLPESELHATGSTHASLMMIKNNVVTPLLDMTNNVEDAAASLQKAVEVVLYEIMEEARKYGSKLCFSGGVAQNILANTKIRNLFDDVWVDVCAHDGGAALGAAGWKFWQDTGIDRVNWEHPFLGHEIEGTVDPEEVVDHLLSNQICGIANGRAEYSPRAYGNRSLIADVRHDVKDTVNEIKRRQKFRPFAPAILEEYADEYFEGPMNRWMQYSAKAKHPYSSVTHVDGTARVQLVSKDHPSVFRQILECYHDKTGVPMLLNTSLNIRGKPMVNDKQDAIDFERKYGVKVF